MTEEKLEESQQSAECRAAIQAAVEKVGEYCSFGGMGVEGGKYTVKFAGATIEYPEEINQIAIDETLEDNDCIKAISETGWAINQARALCKLMTSPEGLVRFEGGSVEPHECTDLVATELATHVVKLVRHPEEAYAEKYAEGL